jgi:hypothetical protein
MNRFGSHPNYENLTVHKGLPPQASPMHCGQEGNEGTGTVPFVISPVLCISYTSGG